MLRGRRLDHDVFEMPETALMREALARGPSTRHDLDRFLEPRLRLFRRNLKALEFAVPVALADAEIEPTARRSDRASPPASASSTGLCHGSTITAVPSRSVVVRIASAVSSISVAETWFQPLK